MSTLLATATTPLAADQAPGVRRVRPAAATTTRQRLPTFVGIAGATVGATGIAMHLVTIPPGAAAEPHWHAGHETAIYILQGRVETRFGPGLAETIIGEAGDFLYIGPDVLHQPINLSLTEPVLAVVARTDPAEQEHVILAGPAPAA